MMFNSFSYLLFLPVVYLIFYFTVDRWRWLVLLAASYGFYAAFKAPYLLAVLCVVTCTSYVCGLRMAAHQDNAKRQKWLWAGIAASVATLVLLKYFPVLETQANRIFGLSSSLSKALIIIGVSYFTFQSISYLADVYLEIEEPEHHFGYYALYLAFFPKLLQGPIERARDLLPQLKQPYEFNYDNIRNGLFLFAWGLLQKVVIADRIALYADYVYDDVHAFTGLPLLLATYAYAFQIYMDFSGYTNMALGTARLFNINLTQNFRSPYTATSVADFWRRWHISFSRWILDYIFKPLQMSWRAWGTTGTASALIVAFLISGIWHGASWGFLVWGVLHGLYLASSVYYKPYQKKLHKSLGLENTWLLKVWQVFVTFNLVSFAWVFFRSANIADATYVMTNMCNGTKGMRFFLSQGGMNLSALVMSVACIMIVPLDKIYNFSNIFRDKLVLRWMLYCSLSIYIIFFAVRSKNQFIYFGF